MNTDHAEEFGRRLVALAEVFDVKLSPQRQALYFDALRDLPYESCVTALHAAVKVCKFFPRPVELREFVQGDAEDAAEAAWVAFRQAMGRIGHYSSLVVRDAALGEAILALFGTWPAACCAELSPEMWASKRKEFGRVYRMLRQRRLEGSRYLPGVAEHHNSQRAAWIGFSPVGVLERDGTVRALAGAEAERERQAISAAAHGFQALAASIPSLPRQLEEAQ